MIIEHDQRERLAHAPFNIAGEHAHQHLGAAAISQAMMDRPDLEIDPLHAAERPLGAGQIFVAAHQREREELCCQHIDGDNVDAIKPALGADRGVAGKRKLIIGDGQREALGHLVVIEHGTVGKPDPIGAAERSALARYRRGDFARFLLRRSQQCPALARPFVRQEPAAADHQPLIRGISGRHLGRVAVTEQRQLQRPVLSGVALEYFHRHPTAVGEGQQTEAAGYPRVRIVVSSGVGVVKCRVMADAKAPIDVVGTGGFISDSWRENHGTSDIAEYDGVPLVKVGREFLVCRNGTPRRGDGNRGGQV